jgi:hypothetical protein
LYFRDVRAALGRAVLNRGGEVQHLEEM